MVFFPLENFSGFPPAVIIWNPPTSTIMETMGMEMMKRNFVILPARQERSQVPKGLVRSASAIPKTAKRRKHERRIFAAPIFMVFIIDRRGKNSRDHFPGYRRALRQHLACTHRTE